MGGRIVIIRTRKVPNIYKERAYFVRHRPGAPNLQIGHASPSSLWSSFFFILSLSRKIVFQNKREKTMKRLFFIQSRSLGQKGDMAETNKHSHPATLPTSAALGFYFCLRTSNPFVSHGSVPTQKGVAFRCMPFLREMKEKPPSLCKSNNCVYGYKPTGERGLRRGFE